MGDLMEALHDYIKAVNAETLADAFGVYDEGVLFKNRIQAENYLEEKFLELMTSGGNE